MNNHGISGDNSFVPLKRGMSCIQRASALCAVNPEQRGVLNMWDKIALILLIIGGINWGLVGIFEFDMVAWLFGGAASVISRAVYILVAISAVWCISLLFRKDEELAVQNIDR